MKPAAQAAETWPSEQHFTGTNVTSGGSVFQGTIRTESGAVNINLGGNIRDQRRLNILTWLSNVQYFRHHKFAKSKRLQGTGEWLLQRSEYQQWANNVDSAIFWLYGIPGAGKTELASLVIDRVTEDLQSTTETALLYFYCGGDETDRRSSTCLMRTLIHQLLCTSPYLFEMVDMIYEENRISGFSHGVLDFADSKELLAAIIPKFKMTFIIIDALDECDVNNRADILEAFKRLSSLQDGIVKIFVSSRYSDDIALALDDHVKLLIKTQDNNGDISRFVEKEIDLVIRTKKLLRGKVDHELQQNLKSTLTEGSNGMFLWARLQITHLCDAITKADLLLALEELPLGLKETYHGMWRKVQKQRLSRKSLAEQALELLLYSVQPLSANAVAEAVTPDDHVYGHENEIVDVALILDVCQSLVVLDSELGILRPIHFTAQTFLKDHFPESGSHSRIAVNCLRHISNQATLNKATNMSFNGADTIADFAIYAILNWPVHPSRGDKNSKVESLERDLMKNEMLNRLWIRNLRVLEEHSSRKHLLLLDLLKAYPEYPDASLISACFFGLRSVELAIHFQPIQYRIHEHPAIAEYFSWKPSETGNWRVTGLDLILSDWRIAGLLCASEQGHASIVTQLLKCIPNQNEGSQYVKNQIRYTLECCTQFAIANGHVNTVDAFWKFRDDLVFTRFGMNCPYRELGGGTLALAAFRGQRKVIELLLSSYCPRPERPPSHWKSTAARWQNDRDFDGPHWMLACDLTATARWHNEKAFALLLSYANSHNNLTSALFSAASANTGKIIELILGTSTVSLETLPIISPGVIKSQNQTPFVLVNAIERWNSAGEITTARAPAAWARTALITAAWGDCGAAGKALCRDSRVDLHICDESGMNALQISVLECHTDFLESILERDDLDVNVRGRWGETPLILAVRKGHTAVVRLLLNSGKADTSLTDMGGLTAMDIAGMKDHEPIINLLPRCNAPSRELSLREDEDEATHSPSIAQQIGRWFQ